MLLKKLPYALTICKPRGPEDIDLSADFYFLARTDEELSLVCRTEDVPAATTERDDGWRGFRIEGVYADRTGHAEVKCRKCKFEGPVNLAYFRRQKRHGCCFITRTTRKPLR